MKPVFDKMGKNVTLVGGSGDGQTTKVANQIIVALTIEAVGEALLFASRAGADPALVRQALMGGFASSRILEVHGERMVKRNFDPGFRIELHQKDLNLALEGARALGLSLPSTAVAQQLFSSCAAHGGKTWDHSAMVRALEMMANHEIGTADAWNPRREPGSELSISPDIRGKGNRNISCLRWLTQVNSLEDMMNKRFAVSLIAASLLTSGAAFAQSTTAQGAADGARAGGQVAGPVGEIVGGTVGAAVGAAVEIPNAVITSIPRNEPSVMVRERVVVGEPLPPTVELRTVPSHTEYRYAVVNDRRVIVEPRTRKIIRIID